MAVSLTVVLHVSEADGELLCSIHFKTEDIFDYFKDLPREDHPTLDTFRASAQTLVHRYVSEDAYYCALSQSKPSANAVNLEVPLGSMFHIDPTSSVPRNVPSMNVDEDAADTESSHSQSASPSPEPEAFDDSAAKTKATDKKPFIEKEGFMGDRVRANDVIDRPRTQSV